MSKISYSTYYVMVDGPAEAWGTLTDVLEDGWEIYWSDKSNDGYFIFILRRDDDH